MGGNHVKSSLCYFYCPALQIVICLGGVYNLCNIRTPSALRPSFCLSNNLPKTVLAGGNIKNIYTLGGATQTGRQLNELTDTNYYVTV